MMAAPIAEPPHLAGGSEDAVPVDDHGAVAAAGRAGHPPASGAGRLPRAAGPSGGNRAPGAPHPTPHAGSPLPDAQDARRLLVRRATGPRPRRGPAGLRLQLRRRGRQRRPRRRGGDRQDPSGHRPGDGLLPARLPGALPDRRRNWSRCSSKPSSRAAWHASSTSSPASTS